MTDCDDAYYDNEYYRQCCHESATVVYRDRLITAHCYKGHRAYPVDLERWGYLTEPNASILIIGADE